MRHWIAALALAAPVPALAAQAPEAVGRTISIGRTHSIASARMGEARTVNVVLPAGYEKAPGKAYSVLYLIDGGIEQDLLHVAGGAQLGGMWGRSADAIVVGIETRDRRKELVGSTKDPELLKRYPTAGASAAFRDFIRDEVKPLIARNNRTNGHEAVVGESLAGLFILETYLTEPELFDAYAAIDPSLWWDQEALSRAAAGKIGPKQKERPVYLAMAGEQAETPAAMARVVQAIGSASPRLCATKRTDLRHSTIYQQLTPQALQFVLPPKEAPAPEFGFPVQCDKPEAGEGAS